MVGIRDDQTLRDFPDVNPGTVTNVDDAGCLQAPQGLTDCRSCDGKEHGQFLHRRKAVARFEIPGRDECQELSGELP